MAIVRADVIERLPVPVRRSLQRSGVVGTEVPSTVVVRQRGRIRTDEDARWLRFVATQQYEVDPPGFVWNASLKIGGLTVGKAIDTLDDGHGHMTVKLLGAFTVVDEAGPELDQGTALRWLNETMWFPAVWATDAIAWEPIDDMSARASVTVGDLTVDAVFVFDGEGRLVDCRAYRYFIDSERRLMAPWSTPLSDHESFGDVYLPSAGSAVWALDDGDLEYIQIEVTDVRYV